MSDWKIIVPEAKTNYVLNPVAGDSANFAAVGGGTMTRSTTYSLYGLRSFRIQTAANDQGGSVTLLALPNAICYVTVRVRGTLPASWDWSVNDSNYTVPTLIEAIDSNWSLYGVQFPAAQCNGQTTLYIRQNGAGSGDFYVDGVDIEEAAYWTTHVDGDRQGCWWDGAEHASSSRRSAVSRAGGRVRDLHTDYAFNIDGMIGTGAPPQTVTLDEYALLPGGELNSVKIHPRPFSLTGSLCGSSYSNLNSIRGSLVNLLLPDAYPKDELGWQPVRLIYTGGASKRQISAHYEGGLEGNIPIRELYTERVAIRFISADNPFWQDAEEVESALALDSSDSATIRFVAARLRSTGQWDDLGSPGGAASTTGIQAIAEDATYVYFGGSFTDFNGDTSADRIVRYNKSTQTWSNLGAADGTVNVLVIGSDGSLYAGGGFTNIGGTAMNYIGKWNGSTWSALGTGLNNFCYAIAFGLDGTLYAGGTFTTAGGSGANRIASWDGSSWSNLGTGTNNTYVSSLAVHPNGDLYLGGDFTTAGGVSCNYIASWDGSAYSALGSGLNSYTNIGCMAFLNTILYVGGHFTTAGGGTVNYIAQWNGTTWSDLAGGTDADVEHVAVAPDGKVFICGSFTSVGQLGNILSDAAFWNGSSWAHLDCEIPSYDWEVMFPSPYTDPVTGAYDLWAGVSASLASFTMTYGGAVTATNAGTVQAYPVIVIERSGGTSALMVSVRNETSNKELLFDYALLDGEALTIDLNPIEKTIVSSLFGPRPDAILANSDFGEFALLPGDNQITCFVHTAGAPTITATMTWQNQYR